MASNIKGLAEGRYFAIGIGGNAPRVSTGEEGTTATNPARHVGSATNAESSTRFLKLEDRPLVLPQTGAHREGDKVSPRMDIKQLMSFQAQKQTASNH